MPEEKKKRGGAPSVARTSERVSVDPFAQMKQMAGNTGESFGSTFMAATAVPAQAMPIGFAAKVAQEFGLQPAKEQSYLIPIDHVLDSPYQHRLPKEEWSEKQKREYERLRLSIQEGLNEVFFVCPYPKKPGYFFLAFGGHNRRDLIAEMGETAIPCQIVEFTEGNEVDEEKIGFGTTFENETKVPMTLEERGAQYQHLMENFQLTQEKLAKRLDVSRDFIKECLRISRSSQDIRTFVRELDEKSGIRISRTLQRLDALSTMLTSDGAEDAPTKARVPLIQAYKQRTILTEAMDAYVETILLLAKEHPSWPIEEILNKVFEPIQSEHRSYQREQVSTSFTEEDESSVEDPELVIQDTHRIDGGTDTSESRKKVKRDMRDEKQVVSPITSLQVHPEESLRIDALTKALRYIKKYQKLAHKPGDEQEQKKDIERDLLNQLAVAVSNIHSQQENPIEG